MAEKKYTKGEVINIFGRVIGKGIEIIGTGILSISRLFARLATGLFWIAGKHVDMIETIKGIGQNRIIDDESIRIKSSGKTEIIENKKEPMSESDSELMLSRVDEKLKYIETALMYSQSAYKNNVISLKEVYEIDNQSILMSKLIKDYIKQLKDSQKMSMVIKKAEAFINASTFFLKYHRTGTETFREKAERYLVEAKGE